ncbi:MAG: hypothetical protein JRN24_00015 [Nitrososphaerota archaeon]|nr:hypothetical protein [Nitrososphaerota archaeon]
MVGERHASMLSSYPYFDLVEVTCQRSEGNRKKIASGFLRRESPTKQPS